MLSFFLVLCRFLFVCFTHTHARTNTHSLSLSASASVRLCLSVFLSTSWFALLAWRAFACLAGLAVVLFGRWLDCSTHTTQNNFGEVAFVSLVSHGGKHAALHEKSRFTTGQSEVLFQGADKKAPSHQFWLGPVPFCWCRRKQSTFGAKNKAALALVTKVCRGRCEEVFLS